MIYNTNSHDILSFYLFFYVETLNKRSWINLRLLIQMLRNFLTFYDMGKSHLTVLNILDLSWNQKDLEKLVNLQLINWIRKMQKKCNL